MHGLFSLILVYPLTHFYCYYLLWMIDDDCHMWNRICSPYRGTWHQPRFLMGFVSLSLLMLWTVYYCFSAFLFCLFLFKPWNYHSIFYQRVWMSLWYISPFFLNCGKNKSTRLQYVQYHTDLAWNCNWTSINNPLYSFITGRCR